MKIKDGRFYETVSAFLKVYLPKNMSRSPNTVKAYEDTLNLYLLFLEEIKNTPREKVTWDFFRRQTVMEFLDWLERERGCGESTKAQRLAAIRAFVRYGGVIDLRVMAIQADVEKIEFKKAQGKLVEYLSKEELEVFLTQPDPAKRSGFRDMAFLNLMYDTAARCQELLDLKIRNLKLSDSHPVVYLTGKGKKNRVIPLMEKTAEHMRAYLKKFHPSKTRKSEDYVFYTHHAAHQMSADNVGAFVRKYGEMARRICPSIPERVHPHMIRHTRAMHFYQGGMDLQGIADWLGHEHTETTRIYVISDTEMKREAMRKATPSLQTPPPEPIWDIENEEMMRKLKGKKRKDYPEEIVQKPCHSAGFRRFFGMSIFSG